jgi:uncharacterized protein
MFLLLFSNLRRQEILIGISEWLTFLRGLEMGLVTTLDELYGFGRTVLCTSEAQFDGYDLAFHASFEGIELPENISDKILSWLEQTQFTEKPLVTPDIPIDKLWEEFYKRLQEQQEKHDGGGYWIGTGGRSPFGHSGYASHGIRVGGVSKNRSAVSLAANRQWETYRTDTSLQTRDFQMALKALRKLLREGEMELNIDGTIKKTAHNAGDIELDFQREKINRIHLVLLMDSGGSMEPHARLVEQLFTAAEETKGFKSFQALHFHNTPYGFFYKNEFSYERISIDGLLQDWTSKHRIVWVGDACMAPYELLTPMSRDGMRGIDWIQKIVRKCPNSVWLNPDSPHYWGHQTISAVGNIIPMFPLTVSGLRDAVSKLRFGQHR